MCIFEWKQMSKIKTRTGSLYFRHFKNNCILFAFLSLPGLRISSMAAIRDGIAYPISRKNQLVSVVYVRCPFRKYLPNHSSKTEINRYGNCINPP